MQIMRKMKKVLALVAALAMLVSMSLAVHASPPVNPADRCMDCMVDGNPRVRYVPGVPYEDADGSWRTHPPVTYTRPRSEFDVWDFSGGRHLISGPTYAFTLPGYNASNTYTGGQAVGVGPWLNQDPFAGWWNPEWGDQWREVPVPNSDTWVRYGDPQPPLGPGQRWVGVGGCVPSTCTDTDPAHVCWVLARIFEWQTRHPIWGPAQVWVTFTVHGGWVLQDGYFEYYCACDEPVNDVPVNDVPVNDVPVNDVPVNDVPVNDVPVNDVPVNDVPVNDGGCECCDCCEACDCDECCDCCEECPAPPAPPTPGAQAPQTGDVASAATSAPLMIASVLALLTLSGGALLKRKK